MSSNNSTSQCSPSSRCTDDASIIDREQPSPRPSLNRLPSASHRRRNCNIIHPYSTHDSSETDFPRSLFLDENCGEEDFDTFKIHRKLLRRRFVRREQNRKKRQREMEKARQMELEAEKPQIQNNEQTALQSTSDEDTVERVKQKQRLLQSPSFGVSCGVSSPCNSPAINLPCFSPLRSTKRRNTRVTH